MRNKHAVAQKIRALMDLWFNPDPKVEKTYTGIIAEARQHLGEYSEKFIELFQQLSAEEKDERMPGGKKRGREAIYKLAQDIEKAAQEEIAEKQPKDLKDFFQFYREKLATDKQSSEEKLERYFDSLAEATKQQLMRECAKLEGFEDCVTLDQSGVVALNDVIVQLFLLHVKEGLTKEESRIKLLPEPGKEKSVEFADFIVGANITETMRNIDGNYYIIDKSNRQLRQVVFNKETVSYDYKKPGKETFIQALHTQFKNTTYTITDAIRDKNVDYLLKHHASELLELEPPVLMSLNYHYIDEQFKVERYGTLLHKAIDSKNAMNSADFYKLYMRIFSNLFEATLWASYSNLRNEKGQTVFNLARERLIVDLPGEERVVARIDSQSTHTQSVHKNVDQAIVRLAKKMDRDLGFNAVVGSATLSDKLTKDDPITIAFTSEAKKKELQDVLNTHFDNLKNKVDKLAVMNDAELFEYIKPSLEKFEIEQGPNCKPVQELKNKLLKIKDMLDDIANHNRFHQLGSIYSVDANGHIRDSLNLSYKEILSLAYYSSQDEHSLSGITAASDKAMVEKVKINAEISFLAGLYDVRRGYNIDNEDYNHSNPDKNRCIGGTVNSLINSLNSCHKLVEVRKISDVTLKDEMKSKINEYLCDPNRSQMLDQKSFKLNLLLWQQNNTMPSDLKVQFNTCFKDEILEEFTNEYGSYLDEKPERQRAMMDIIYQEAFLDMKISQELQKQIKDFDVSMIPDDQLDMQLTSGLGALFILSKNGYTTFLNHIFNQNPSKFEGILARAVASNKLMNLINDDFSYLSLLSPPAKAKFIESYMALGAVTVNTYRGNGADPMFIWALRNRHFDIVKMLKEFPGLAPEARDLRYVFLSAAEEGDLEVIEILKNIPGINPNCKPSVYTSGLDTRIYTALIWAVVNGHYKVIEALREFPGIDPNIKGEWDMTALMYAVKAENIKFIKALKDFPGIDPNVKNDNGQTALMLAVKENNIKVIMQLLKSYHNIEVPVTLAESESISEEAKAILISYQKQPTAWLLRNKADVEVIVKRALSKNLKLNDKHKQKIALRAAQSDRPDIVVHIISRDLSNIEYLNSKEVADAIIDCLNRASSFAAVAPVVKVNILNKLKEASESPEGSAIDKEKLNVSLNNAVEQLGEYNKAREVFMALTSADLEANKQLLSQALLGDDHILVKKFEELAMGSGGITILYAGDAILKLKALKYAERALVNIDKIEPAQKKELLEVLQHLGGGPEGNIFTKWVNTNIVEGLKLVNSNISEQGKPVVIHATELPTVPQSKTAKDPSPER